MSRPKVLYREQEGWQDNKGRNPGPYIVRVAFEQGSLSNHERPTSWWNWKRAGMPFDIRSFQIVREDAE
jgi:hypothetical protein